VRFGIVGCGRHGERYLRHLARGDVEGASAVAIWRRDRSAAAELAARYRVRAQDDWAELCADPGVDAVIVTTPPGAHAGPIRAAAAAGKPVLTEKPLTATFAEALALSSDLPTGARVMVAQTLRFAPALRDARARLPDLGEIHRIRIAQRLEPNAIAWQRDRALAGGGSVTLTGVHVFDLLRWFAGGTPDRVSALTRTLLDHPFENLFEARFEYLDRPLLASCEVCKFSPSRSARLELVGTRGQLWVDYLAGRVEWLDGSGRRLIADHGDRPTIPPTLDAFRRWVLDGTACPVPITEGIETLRMADACYRSAAAGRTVSVSADEPISLP
jgi:predicted dehydrogenase